MKIRLLGVAFEAGNGITLDDLFHYLKSAGATPKELGGYKRFVYVNELDGHHVGLLITTKNHKKFLEFFNDPANAKLTAREVSEGAAFADFNFFAINKTTGKGIFQYYHQSCSLNMFGMLCKFHYDRLKSLRLTAALSQHKQPTAKQENAIRQQYAGTLTWETVVRKETFEKLLEEFKSIGNLTLSVSTLAYEDTEFTPISHLANKMSQRYTFRAGTNTQQVVGAIKSVIGKVDVDGARVEGVDGDDLERVIKLINTPDFFGEYDFDKVASTMNISPSQFSEAAFLKEMIKQAKTAPALQAHKK